MECYARMNRRIEWMKGLDHTSMQHVHRHKRHVLNVLLLSLHLKLIIHVHTGRCLHFSSFNCSSLRDVATFIT
uniref:Ovule protein n=1 Tax=Caenorhabditis tropicalis TaxID=1561998 RepID=A0A1I7V4Z6_9PELO